MFYNWLLYFSFHKLEDYKSPFETKNMEVKDEVYLYSFFALRANF